MIVLEKRSNLRETNLEMKIYFDADVETAQRVCLLLVLRES